MIYGFADHGGVQLDTLSRGLGKVWTSDYRKPVLFLYKGFAT